MAKLSVNEIRDVAVEIVKQHPEGIRYTQLHEAILSKDPETPANTIGGSIWNLEVTRSAQVAKPARGVYRPAAAAVAPAATEAPDQAPVRPRVSEDAFYEPFAEWLKNDLDEASEAFALGGSALRGKWGTPDVVGVYKPMASNHVKFPLEIISAEIKTDPAQPVVAFGQAIAYRLFSWKTYIAMPRSIALEDLSRLDSLCSLFGVGLVLFDLKPEEPAFEIRARAQRFSPDMFYVNEFADRVKEHDSDLFEKLFG